MKGNRTYIRITRRLVQAGFIALTVLICVKLYAFVFQFAPGVEHSGQYLERPTGVDAFLPIGGFMALKYFVFTLGNIEPSHPAAMIFFLAIVVSSMLVKKGFCGWICPVGTISEYVSMLGDKLFKGNKKMPGKLDLGLMSIKYLLMFAFVFLIVVMPSAYMVLFFVQGEYKMMDGRMMLFFMDASKVTITVLGTLFVLTLFFKSFWCRYLCPYGALLGIMSYLSPFKVRRDDDKCINCKACTRICPMQIEVQKEEAVTSAECFGCLSCVSRCPEDGALDITYKPAKTVHVLKKPLVFVVALLAIFYAIVGASMALGVYKSRLPIDEYQEAVPYIMERRRGAEKPAEKPVEDTTDKGALKMNSHISPDATISSIPGSAIGSRDSL